MTTFEILVHDAKFWAAVLLLLQAVLFFFVPEFPREIWAALSAVLGIVFAALTGRATVVESRRVRGLK